MAKPKVVKVSSQFQLRDFFYSEKLKTGEKVCLLLPLRPNAKHTKRKFKFAKGILKMRFVTYCDCCGPDFQASLTKADGTVIELSNGYRSSKAVLPF